MPQLTKPDPFAGCTEILPSGAVRPPYEDHTTFVDDRWLAGRIGMKVPTIRSQRFKRLHGEPHWLTLDPIYFGSKPRYRRAEAINWLQERSETTTSL